METKKEERFGLTNDRIENLAKDIDLLRDDVSAFRTKVEEDMGGLRKDIEDAKKEAHSGTGDASWASVAGSSAGGSSVFDGSVRPAAHNAMPLLIDLGGFARDSPRKVIQEIGAKAIAKILPSLRDKLLAGSDGVVFRPDKNRCTIAKAKLRPECNDITNILRITDAFRAIRDDMHEAEGTSDWMAKAKGQMELLRGWLGKDAQKALKALCDADEITDAIELNAPRGEKGMGMLVLGNTRAYVLEPLQDVGKWNYGALAAVCPAWTQDDVNTAPAATSSAAKGSYWQQEEARQHLEISECHVAVARHRFPPEFQLC